LKFFFSPGVEEEEKKEKKKLTSLSLLVFQTKIPKSKNSCASPWAPPGWPCCNSHGVRREREKRESVLI
jgi:hypothetical protein